MRNRTIGVAVLVTVMLAAGLAYVAWPEGDGHAVPVIDVSATSAPYGVFEGRVPCGNVCERIKVRLTLFRDPATNAPTDYLLERIYVGQGDDRLTTRGRWQAFDAGIPDRWGVAYRLDEQAPADFSTYLPVGDVLLFLNPDLQPRVGDASHSFTLSRTR